MKLRSLATICLVFLFVSRQSSADKINLDPSIATASAIAPGAIINRDLAPSVWSFHPTMGYFTASTSPDGTGSTAASQGYGGTGEAQYSWNEHLGVNFSALGYNGSGNYTPASPSDGSSGTCKINGWLIGAAFVLDPFSGDGFRMPFFFGLNYEHLLSSTPTSATFTSVSLSSPGYTFGFSPRFNVWFLRLEPFLVVTTPFKEGNEGCASGVMGNACGSMPVQILPVVGVNVVFRPWNLAFFVNVSSILLDSGASFYSLGPQFTF